ncbi:MAG: hypothetical protein RID09_28720 [Coleofasciculus sp. G1-WW12-02]|uniref:hypothetical protein n=1 Tax=Coleofasciculus sp. G1-WW12-02 TaxID=3068483 RepID=UPI0032F26BA3
MAVFVNSTNYAIHFVGYRADGLKFEQNDPNIYPNNARFINQDHFGDTSWYIVVAYELGASIPDKVGLDSSTSGGGLSVTIPGYGSIGASVSGATLYSNGLAVVKAGPHDLWEVREDSKGGWGFLKVSTYSKERLHGW